MKLEQAARQALEALEGVLKTGDTQVLEYTAPPVLTALREALAEQAEQEPVAWRCWNMPDERWEITTDKSRLPAGQPLYAAPVRQVDLTDDEIADIRMSIIAYEPVEWGRVFARAVIAADREKNKCQH